MTSPEHLPHAPITEAILDIACTLPANVDHESLAGYQSKLGGRYPGKQVRNQWKSVLEVSGSGPPIAKSDGGPIGYLFRTADTKQVVQARLNGFTFSRLQPYVSWDALSAEARLLWDAFVAFAKPTNVTRIAVRYINKMPLPLPISDFKEYVLTGVEIAPTLPQAVTEYFFRVAIPVQDPQAVAILTQTIDTSDAPKGTLPLILDIDIFRQGSFPITPAKLWPLFSPLHDLKNRFFFESITDKTKELFK